MPTIADLNDEHREKIPRTKTIISRGIDRLGPTVIERVLEKVRKFDDFNPDNDLFSERDYASFEEDGERIYFKIDYFDKDGKFGSEDPSDPSKTMRVLTIALLSEY